MTILAMLGSGSAFAQATPSESASPEPGVGDIIVTAQKRAQSQNSVGMSIQALSSDTLAQRGISSVEDLVKAVPGFSASNSGYGSSVYTLRGVGLNDYNFGSAPAVAVYQDELPLSFSVMQTVAPLDVQQVEVLKGPQGILFGQSSTGGAINYIAAKPTAEFQAGLDTSYARFNRIEANGFVTGALSDTLNARLAVHTDTGGAWQRSTTRDDRIGDARVLQGRLLLDWAPNDRLSVLFNVNGYTNRSDTQIGQLTEVHPLVPALSPPDLLSAPVVIGNNRDADWSPNRLQRFDDKYGQLAMTVNYGVADDVTLTSLTSFQHMKLRHGFDYDATAANVTDSIQYGKIEAFNQELRLAGETDAIKWLVGATYERDTVSDNTFASIPGYSGGQPFPTVPRLVQYVSGIDQKIRNYGLFGNVEFAVNDNLTLYGGLRYSNSSRHGTNCSKDGGAGNQAGQLFMALQQLFIDLGVKTTPLVPIGSQDCYPLDENYLPGAFETKLKQDNVSFRLGVDYKTDGGTLLYANFRRGYKDGMLPTLPASTTSQFAPATQERLDAWEAGIKAPLAQRTLQLNAAAFYYDYVDKQVLGNVADPLFGLLTREINIPKSRIWGAEAELTAQPIDGLVFSGSVTYIDSKITSSFVNYNGQGSNGDFKGSRLPFAPTWSAAMDGQYSGDLSESLRGFVGASLLYRGKDWATFENANLPAPDFKIDPYTLLDLRAGIGASDQSWELSIWGRNITDKYYWTNVIRTVDTTFRFTGRPATYGVTLKLRTR